MEPGRDKPGSRGEVDDLIIGPGRGSRLRGYQALARRARNGRAATILAHVKQNPGYMKTVVKDRMPTLLRESDIFLLKSQSLQVDIDHPAPLRPLEHMVVMGGVRLAACQQLL